MNANLDLARATSHRLVRAVAILVAVSAALAAFAPAAAHSTRATTTPTIYVNYTTACTFTMQLDGGTQITTSTAPGVVIPPGMYQVVISQAYALEPGADRCPTSTFHITGPGVSFAATVAEGSSFDQGTEIFPASSTYVASVDNQPLVQLVFTTAATGSSSTLVGQTTTTSPGQGQVQPGLVGSDVSHPGTLRATVGATGKATLTDGGKGVVSIQAGEYQIAVDDETAKAGFTMQKLDQRPVGISGAAFTGTRTAKVDLTAGTWTFYSHTGGARRFVVVA